MRQTVQTRLQKCRELQDQPRTPGSRDREADIRSATQASFMADMAGDLEPGMSVNSAQSDSIVALAMGFPYPPSTTRLRDLKPMSIAELRMDTHHHGRVLSVRRPAAVVPLVAYSWTIVEDDSGEVERLEVYLHKAKRGEDMLDSASAFKIKEPYFTINEQGEATIRVHHPSDLVRQKEAPAAKTAQKCKAQGNAALASKDFVEAHDSYTQGLRMIEQDPAASSENQTLRYDLLRNRAHVNLILTRFSEAKADAVASITDISDEQHRSLDGKANFRAGTAAYNLGEYEGAQHLFQASLSLAPDDKVASVYLRNIEARLREKRTGEYSFSKLRAKLSRARPRVDAATFTGATEIRQSPLGGRGLFATRAFNDGDLVLCEKAFCVAWSHEKDAWTGMTYDVRDDRIRAFPAGLTKAIVQKLLNEPSHVAQVMELYADHKSSVPEILAGIKDLDVNGDGEKDITVAKDTNINEDDELHTPAVDAFEIHDIVARNAFGPGAINDGIGNDGAENIRVASAGLWLVAAAANHSCLSNTTKSFVGDLLILRATRAIAAGDELTHSYDETSDHEARAAALMTTWGFTCTCQLCRAEEADTPQIRQKRRELVAEADALVTAAQEQQQRAGVLGASKKRLSVVRAEKLLKAIEETYDQARYKDLPRTASASLQAWLQLARRS